VWEQFHDCVLEKGEKRGLPSVACMHCHKTYVHPNLNTGMSTTSLTRHLQNCAQYQRLFHKNSSDKDAFSQFFRSNESGASPKDMREINEEAITQAVLDFFVSGDIPFNQAENPRFKNLITMIHLSSEGRTGNTSKKLFSKPASGPSRKTVRARLDRHAEKAKEQLRNELAANESKISLALDIWTGGANYAFIGTLYIRVLLSL
jgi:hypothetical protein